MSAGDHDVGLCVCVYELLLLLLFCIETQTMLGPVVVCGPSKVRLCKPLIITFQHCASIKHGQWMLSIYCCDTPYGEPPHWQVVIKNIS